MTQKEWPGHITREMLDDKIWWNHASTQIEDYLDDYSMQKLGSNFLNDVGDTVADHDRADKTITKLFEEVHSLQRLLCILAYDYHVYAEENETDSDKRYRRLLHISTYMKYPDPSNGLSFFERHLDHLNYKIREDWEEKK